VEETDEVALMQMKVAHLERERDRGATTRNRGLKLLLLVPLNFLAALIALVTLGGHGIVSVLLVASCIYAVIGGVGGLALAAIGTAQRRVAGERLAELEERRRLPEARVVVR
jgi:multisubunit Na+/H+ antiporter MnhB subunit